MIAKTLVICPLQVELRYLAEGFRKLGAEVQTESREIRCGRNVGNESQSLTIEKKIEKIYFVPERNFILVRGGHGKVEFAVRTLQWLSHFGEEVGFAICVGGAGGLATELQIGDVLVAENIIEHDYIERFDQNAKSPMFSGHAEMLARVSAINAKFGFHWRVCLVASGDEDIIDSVRAEELVKKTSAHGVAWEGAGGARACRSHQIPFLEIRGITDNARHEVAANFAKNLEVAMANVAKFLWHY